MKSFVISRIPSLGITYVFYLTIILQFGGLSCWTDNSKEIEKPKPNLVIIGEDLSGTFDKFPPTTENDLRNLCNAVAKSKSGGKVYFIGIGSSTPKGYAYCVIKPLKEIDRHDPPSRQRYMKIYNQNVAKKNDDEIEKFLANAVTIFEQRNQKYTDINGFFEKAASILSTPSHKRFLKWLYINSDGKQATLSSNKVDCDLRPAVDEYYVNRGWKNTTDCGSAEKLPDTHHFIEYFRQVMEANSIAGQNLPEQIE